MNMPAYGGNSKFATGQITLSGVGQLIPVPSGIQNSAIDSAVLRITAGAGDAYFGSVSSVTTSTGGRIPANTVYPHTACRAAVYVLGTVGDVISYSWEWNG